MFLISYSLQFRSTPCTLPRRGFVCGLQRCLSCGVIWQHLLRAEWDAAELLCALLLPAGSETLQCGEHSPQLSFRSCTSSTGSSCSQCRARTHAQEEVRVFVSPPLPLACFHLQIQLWFAGNTCAECLSCRSERCLSVTLIKLVKLLAHCKIYLLLT